MKVLQEEYNLRDRMDNFEHNMKKLLQRTHTYGLTEFFTEKDQIVKEIDQMKHEINSFSHYCPSYTLSFSEEDDAEIIIDRLKTELKTKLEKNLVEISTDFSLNNFNYVTKELGQQRLTDIY